MIVETVPVHSQVFADSVFTGAFPRFDAKSPFRKNFVDLGPQDLALIAGNSSHSSIVDVGVFQYCLEDDRLEVGGRFMDEGLDHCYLGTVTGGTVSEGNCTISVVRPGGGGRWRRGEGVGRETDDPEEGVLVTDTHRSEELLDVVDGVERVTLVRMRTPRRLGTSPGAG